MSEGQLDRTDMISSVWALAHRKCLLVQIWPWGLSSNMSKLAKRSQDLLQLWLTDRAIAVICSQGDKGWNLFGTSFPSWALTAEKTQGLALPAAG